ncbi:ribosome recycling factor [Puniceicoccales bacterium CK1056]|uniref:Ribosome-recycling factor n=1 Tax=Oceanipulchritudo coccoides TaxID=2706888 RepID=A0A6B2M228_9BACT|nr:ribosome recycling factor [Oceanipulchritudo coccoides]NDV62259.1 ribosome recycling factor [Oceanipulchritudo coccoides]
MDFDTIHLEAVELMQKALQHTLHEFANIHTGKATPAMIENISVHVESYGSNMAIRELGAITTPDNHTLQVTPWDKGTSGAIEKGIRDANLGLNPLSRGATILVPIPELSGDRRKEMVKMAANHAEEGRVSVRQARHHAMDQLKKLKTDGHVSEDDVKRHEKEIQDETDSHVKQINDALAAKEQELLQV